MQSTKPIAAFATLLLAAAQAGATPTDAEIRQLGNTLTPLGAAKSASKDGSIPAWDGGLCKAPAGYKPRKPGGGHPYVDPYAAEKPVLVISAANLAQYADRIDAGTKELFKRYPSYTMEIYPSHRSACFQDWVYENTRNRAAKPRLVADGTGIVDAHAQVPFPIPKTGTEAMWNMILAPAAVRINYSFESGLSDASGTFTLASSQMSDSENTYWDNSTTASPDDKAFRHVLSAVKSPVSQVGVVSLRDTFLRQDLHDDMAWSYSPGQRRVRRSPEFKYDTVSTTSGGLLLFDEINGFDGKLDKYDWKLIGKKEMYVPYNDYKLIEAPIAETMPPHFASPSLMRWELHRVWMVEGTLKEGQRHVEKKKTFYLDEDSYLATVYYATDSSDKVYHLMHLPSREEYDKELYRGGSFILYDLSRGIYGYQNKPDQYGAQQVEAFPQNYFSPDSIGGRGVR